MSRSPNCAPATSPPSAPRRASSSNSAARARCPQPPLRAPGRACDRTPPVGHARRSIVTDTPLLEVRGLNKSFGPVQVLRDVDFSAHAGQVTALVGDNGAGKSTLVKCLGGIYSIDSAEYLFEGRPVSVHGPRDAAALGVEIV